MADIQDRFLEAFAALESLTREVTPEQARATFDEPTLQTFWRDWTAVAAWAGSLWRALSEDLHDPSQPVADPDLDEVGGAG